MQVCQQLRYNVLYRYFCRLGWEYALPDDTTLVRFRQRLVQAVRQAAPQVAKELEVLAEPVPDETCEDQDQLLQAEQERTEALLAAIASQQAAQAPAMRRVRKQVERVLKDERVASHADPEARWGHQRQKKPFFGYKMHLATDETGFVLAATVTAGT